MPGLPPDLTWKIFTQPVTDGYMIGLVVLIVANTVLGVVASWSEKTFEWEYTANWLRTQAVPYLIGWYFLAVMASFASTGLLGEAAKTTFVGGAGLAFLSIVGTLVADVASKLSRLGVLGAKRRAASRRKARAKVSSRLGRTAPLETLDIPKATVPPV